MTVTLGNAVEMIRMGAPRVIHTDEELAAYTNALFELTARTDRTADDEQAIELLTLLVDRYESERFPVPDADPVDVLRFLLASNGLSQRDIVPELGSESTVSLVLSGKRQLNRDHISRLSRRFNVTPSVFFGSGLTLHEAIRIVLLGRESRTATTKEISAEIQKRGLYTRKDGDAARATQINARVRRYPALFEFAGSGRVRLIGDAQIEPGSGKAA